MVNTGVNWTIGDGLKKIAWRMPEKTALIFEDKFITYRELNEGANRVAHFLKEKGIKKGDRIAVYLRNCPEFLEVYFAAAKLGVILVTLNFRLTGSETEYELNNSGSRLLVFHDVYATFIDFHSLNSTVEDDKYICVRSVVPEFEVCVPDWAVEFHQAVDRYPACEPELDEPVDLNDPLAIIYTSGATGVPKGAIVSHLQTFFKNIQIGEYTYIAYIAGDMIMACQIPFFHSGGLFIIATPLLLGGGTLVTRERLDPVKFCQDMEKYKATATFSLTTMWEIMLGSGMLDKVDLSSLKMAAGGGERTPQKLLDDLAERGIYLMEGYGQTENSAMSFMPIDAVGKKKGSVGLPGICTDVWVADEKGNKLPPGQVGRILCKGPTVFSGYWQMPEKTREVLSPDGVLDTGDLGYMDEDGFLYIVGREKDMYRSGGENVYPVEIEKVLRGYPKIAGVAIIGVPDEKWKEVGKAFIVPKKGEKITKEEILSFLEGKVAHFKFPKYIKFIDELPLTADMKVRKVELKQKYGSPSDD